MPTWSAATAGEQAKLGKGPAFFSLLRNEMGARNNGRMKMNWLAVAQTRKFMTMVSQAIIVHRRPGMGCGIRQYTPTSGTTWHFGRMVAVPPDTPDDWLEFKEAQDARPSPRKRADENAMPRQDCAGVVPAPRPRQNAGVQLSFDQLSGLPRWPPACGNNCRDYRCRLQRPGRRGGRPLALVSQCLWKCLASSTDEESTS